MTGMPYVVVGNRVKSGLIYEHYKEHLLSSAHLTLKTTLEGSFTFFSLEMRELWPREVK